MRKFLLAAVLAPMAAVAAKADVVDYAHLFGGVTMSPDLQYGNTDFEMENGYNVGGGLGWNLEPNLTFGVEMMYTTQGYTGFTTNLETMGILMVARYSIDIGHSWSPYIGAGVGGIHVKYDGASAFPTFSGSEWAFGYQLDAGVDIPLQGNVSLLAGYRYQAADDPIIANRTVEYESHNFSIGLGFDL